MTRWIRSLFAMFALLGSLVLPAARVRAAEVPAYGDLHGDLGITGCFYYATEPGGPGKGHGCIVAYRSVDGRTTSITVRRRDEGILHATVPGTSLRRGVNPQNYPSTLLDADVPGVGRISLYTADQAGGVPVYTNAGCFHEPPLTVNLRSTALLGIAETGIFGTVDGEPVVRYGVGCSARFLGETVGHWIMSPGRPYPV